MSLEHVLAWAASTPWAIEPSYARTMLAVLARRASGERCADVDIQAVTHGRTHPGEASQRRGIAVIPVFGIIAQHASMVNDISGPRGTSTESIARDVIQATDDPHVEAIVLNVHSPGGSVFGLEELHRTISARADVKPIVAVANSFAASAAYFIASAASSVSVTPGGMVGSIGTISLHEDLSVALDTRRLGRNAADSRASRTR